MKDYSEYSAPELVRMLGIRFKDYLLPKICGKMSE